MGGDQEAALKAKTKEEMEAKLGKTEENKGEYMEEMLKKIKEHEAYVSKVRSNQEDRLKPYFAELEVNIKEKLSIAEKRREEVLGKVVEAAKAEEKKVSMVRQNKGRILKDQENTPPCGPESA